MMKSCFFFSALFTSLLHTSIAHEWCPHSQDCLPERIYLDGGRELECRFVHGDLHCKTINNEEGTHDNTNSDVAKELSSHGPIPQNRICPRFDGKEFKTRTADGNVATWHVHCNTAVVNPLPRPYPCPAGSVTQILEQRQRNGDYRGLYWDLGGVCQDVLPSEAGWTAYRTLPADAHAFIRRVDFKEP
ncbi:hypothetical protein CP532_6233 [Ophiocordyceps camponoti-leonardi (nom. inval.)]|nr:hypothetical protein CP532_6233 [Ophiocordyceps camponoti-leonardi (nom. inval.)]